MNRYQKWAVIVLIIVAVTAIFGQYEEAQENTRLRQDLQECK